MDFPPPLVVPPFAGAHELTFILLHGRGSQGEIFGPALLDSPIVPSSNTDHHETACLVIAFPKARFVFPTAPRRRATLYKRALTRQWFDNWDLVPPATEQEYLQIDGLRESVRYIHALWRSEMLLVPGGANNVIIGGLSQGCAASLISLLLWDGPPFAAVFGMCGWLPFAERLKEQLHSTEDPDNFDPFDSQNISSSENQESAQDRALFWLQEEIMGFRASRECSYAQTPIFLGHGDLDEKVSIVLGRTAAEILEELGAVTQFRSYHGQGHWYSPGLLRDVVDFLLIQLAQRTDYHNS